MRLSEIEYEATVYNPATGDVETRALDGMLREAVKVRQAAMDDLLRRALIAELERLGYTVTPPSTP